MNGGGQNTRAFHPWVGVGLFFSFAALFVQLWRANLPNKTDVVWLSKFKDVLSGNEDALPEIGKYNAGQKVVFWSMSGLTSVLIVTGIVIWQEYFAVYTAIEAQRVAALAHAFATVIIILIWIAHVYASIWISLHRASAGQPPAFRVRSAPI